MNEERPSAKQVSGHEEASALSRDPVTDLETLLLEKKQAFDAIERRLIDISNQRLGNEMYGKIEHGVPGAYKPTAAEARESKIAALEEASAVVSDYRKDLGAIDPRIRSLSDDRKERFNQLLVAIEEGVGAVADWSNSQDVVRGPAMLRSGENVDVDNIVDRTLTDHSNNGRICIVHSAAEVARLISQLT